MSVEYRSLEAGGRTFRVAVVSPTNDATVGADALETMRTGGRATLPEADLVAEICADAMAVDAVLIRARGPEGSGRFRISHGLDDAELAEAGYLFAAAQLEAWRPLFRRGVIAVGRTELRVWELAALRDGVAALCHDLEQRATSTTGTASAALAADARILRKAVFSFGAGVETVLAEHLPPRLETIAEAS